MDLNHTICRYSIATLCMMLGVDEAGIKDVVFSYREPDDLDQAMWAVWEIELEDRFLRGRVGVHRFDDPAWDKLFVRTLREAALYMLAELHPAGDYVKRALERYNLDCGRGGYPLEIKKND